MNDSEKAKLIMSIVSEHTGVTIDQFLGDRGTWKVSAARNLAMFLVRKHTGLLLKEVAAIFHREDIKRTVASGRDDADVNPKARVIAQIVEREMAHQFILGRRKENA